MYDVGGGSGQSEDGLVSTYTSCKVIWKWVRERGVKVHGMLHSCMCHL